MSNTIPAGESGESNVRVLPEKYWQLARVLGWVGVFLLPMVLYLPVIWFDALIAWDDGVFVLDRTTITSWWSASWSERLLTPDVGYPNTLPTAIAAAVLELAGPEGYLSGLHVVSLLLHLANTFLALKLVQRLLPDHRDTLVPLLIVLAWTAHPAIVESVTWLTNLKNLTGGFGFMLAFICWDEFLSRDEGRKRFAWLALLGVLIGMGSRPEAGFVPLILAVWAFLKTDGPRRKHALIIATPAFAAGIVWALLGKALHDVFMDEMGTTPTVLGLEDHLRGIVESVGFYVMRMAGFVPSDPLYSRGDVGGDGAFALGACALVGVVALAAWLWRTKRTDLLAILASMALLYGPFSNIFPLPRFVADAYLYLFGLFLLSFVAGLVLDLFRSRAALTAWAVVWLVFIGVTVTDSFGYVPRWATTYRLWGPIAESDPASPNPWYFMIHEAVMRDDMDRAATMLTTAEKSLDVEGIYRWYAPAIYAHDGQLDRAFATAKLLYQKDKGGEKVARVTLDLLIAHNRPLSDLDDTEGFADWVIRTYARHPEWVGPNSPHGVTEARIREYLGSQGGAYLQTFSDIRANPGPRAPTGLDAVF